MKRFLLISLLMLAAVTSAFACCAPFVTRYYIYYTPEHESWTDRRDKALAAEWSQLLRTPVTVENVTELDWQYKWKKDDPKKKTDNPILDICFDGRHVALLEYLEFLNDCNKELRFSYDEWDYPSKEQIARHEANLRSYASIAAERTKGKFGSQYRLMQMRCAFALKDYPQCERLWNAAPKSSSVFTEMMRNLYAGVLYRTGRKTEAYAIYTDMGDTESALWCAMKTGDLNNIREFYNQDPNSAVIPYLIPELCANVQETVDAVTDPSGWVDSAGFRKISPEGAEEFITFALKAADNPAVTAPRMWLNAAALVSYYYGFTSRATSLIKRAGDTAGTDDDRLCTSFVKTFIDAANASDIELAQLAPERLDWMLQRPEQHADRMMVRLVYEVLQPRFLDAGMNDDLLFSLAAVSRCKDDKDELIMGYYSDYSDNYFQQLEELPLSDVVAWSEHLASGDCGLWQPIFNRMYPQTDFLNDYIGTRYIRRGEWGNAKAYLARVPLKFIAAQNIAPYAAQRNFRSIPWVTPRERVKCDDYSGRLTSNPKIDFCNYMMSLEEQPSGYSENLRRAAAYFNASRRGKCWYLTSYGYSINSEAPTAPDIDFVAVADRYAAYAAQLKPKQIEPLFARAFIAYDSDMFSYDWDTERNILNLKSPAIVRYDALAAAMRKIPVATQKAMPRMMSRCDILRDFIRLRL